MQKIRTEPWHEHKERRWGSAFDFRKKILRFIERFEALCQHPVPGDPELQTLYTRLLMFLSSLATLPPLEE